jgi:SAM-dependent methyltransferase
MQSLLPHQQKVQQFFDQLASTYARRYAEEQPYLQYWFETRLHSALAGHNFSGKNILDIGAGNGALYHVLSNQFSSFDYTATDLSAAMLAHSKIPFEKRWIGDIQDWTDVENRFDHIFMLGLVTYLEPAALLNHLEWAHQHLQPTGTLGISFTNKASWDFRLRQLLRPLARLLPGKGVVQQEFSIHAHALEEVQNLAQQMGFRIQQTTFLAPSVPFLQYLSPTLAATCARYLNQYLGDSLLRRWLSPDFLVHLVPA